ncbi:hypothetical protein BSU00_09705 [Tenacibaculum sp. SG-28]|nr:hypothetical protein BSU00_09705 [Tenacibaculum sp. SG-28]
MFTVKLSIQKPDNLGILASGLCTAHCFATPFLFIAHSCCTIGASATPSWWRWIDIFFLVVSFFAVYRSGQTTTKPVMKFALWFFWACLCITIINENIQVVPLPEISIYIAGFSLVLLHVYNLRYCQCKTDKCCTKDG